MSTMNIPKFEHFFRVAAALDVDKKDVKRYSDFVHQKTYDLLIRSEAAAKANSRYIIYLSWLDVAQWTGISILVLIVNPAFVHSLAARFEKWLNEDFANS